MKYHLPTWPSWKNNRNGPPSANQAFQQLKTDTDMPSPPVPPFLLTQKIFPKDIEMTPWWKSQGWIRIYDPLSINHPFTANTEITLGGFKAQYGSYVIIDRLRYSRLQLHLNTACVLRALSRKQCSANTTLTQSACMASRLLRIQGHVISVSSTHRKFLASHGHAIHNVQMQQKLTVTALLTRVTTERVEIPVRYSRLLCAYLLPNVRWCSKPKSWNLCAL